MVLFFFGFAAPESIVCASQNNNKWISRFLSCHFRTHKKRHDKEEKIEKKEEKKKKI